MLEEWKDMEPLLCPNMSCCKKRQKTGCGISDLCVSLEGGKPAGVALVVVA